GLSWRRSLPQQHPCHTTFLHLYHLHVPALPLKFVPDHRQTVKQAHDKARQGLIVVGGARLEPDTLAQMTQVHRGIDQHAIALLDQIRPLDLAGVRQFASDGFENVGHGEDTGEVTEFVDDESNVRGLRAHLLKGVEDREAVQQVQCWPGQRQSRIGGAEQPLTDALGCLIQVNNVDVVAHCHHTAHRPLRQLQHAADHHPLAAVENHFATVGVAVEHVGDLVANLLGIGFAPAQQTQHGMGGALAARQIALYAALAPCPGDLVKHFDQDREANGCIQVALGNMETEAVGGQAEADHHQKAQAQHDDGRVSIDECGQRLAGDDHDRDREHHGDHHDRQFVDHAHGSNHGIQREHRVEDYDLRDDGPEQCIGRAARALCDVAFETLVQFHGRLEQQEHPAEQHDQVTAREALPEYFKQRLGQGDHPRDARQQAQPHDQRQGKAQHPRAVTLLGG
nr:hypothetical protein [Tanacetum cinerariifolium]